MTLRPWRRWLLPISATLGLSVGAFGAARIGGGTAIVQFVFTSDAHYGLTRASFRGEAGASAARVNGALIASVNALSRLRFPDDAGVGAGQVVGGLDFLVEGGDIANRAESVGPSSVQPASVSWGEFVHDYVDGLQTVSRSGDPTRLFIVPGNHDASNAVGFHRTLMPGTDPSVMVSIYNLMLRPPQPLQASSFDYGQERLFYSRDLAGLHFQFLQIWPDSAMRARMEDDLAHVDSAAPVIVFTHDQPDAEGKHFINPNGRGDINAGDQFENLLADVFADGPTIDLPSTIEQRQLEAFLVAHPNVTAYFHGNANWHQAYDWNGPARHARLHVFRVDSPMKGAVSASDETRLSFQVVTVDTDRRVMTVRECLWNAQGARTTAPVWGNAATVTLSAPPRS